METNFKNFTGRTNNREGKLLNETLKLIERRKELEEGSADYTMEIRELNKLLLLLINYKIIKKKSEKLRRKNTYKKYLTKEDSRLSN